MGDWGLEAHSNKGLSLNPRIEGEEEIGSRDDGERSDPLDKLGKRRGDAEAA